MRSSFLLYFGVLAVLPGSASALSEVLLDFARTAVENENFGGRGVTDMLCPSFSVNDTVGHSLLAISSARPAASLALLMALCAPRLRPRRRRVRPHPRRG
ncbi:MAG: hypothetical protein ACREH8_02450 [Opitutaceae bacterium]